MDSIISTFHLDWKTILAQMVNFGVVFAVLYIFGLKPLGKIMRDRTKKIEKGILDARENGEILEKSRLEYEATITKAKAQANVLFQEMKKEVSDKKVIMLEETKEEVSKMIESGRKSLENEKTKMVSEAKKEVADLVVEVTEKLLGEKVDAAYQEKAIKELGNLK